MNCCWFNWPIITLMFIAGRDLMTSVQVQLVVFTAPSMLRVDCVVSGAIVTWTMNVIVVLVLPLLLPYYKYLYLCYHGSDCHPTTLAPLHRQMARQTWWKFILRLLFCVLWKLTSSQISHGHRCICGNKVFDIWIILC